MGYGEGPTLEVIPHVYRDGSVIYYSKQVFYLAPILLLSYNYRI